MSEQTQENIAPLSATNSAPKSGSLEEAVAALMPDPPVEETSQEEPEAKQEEEEVLIDPQYEDDHPEYSEQESEEEETPEEDHEEGEEPEETFTEYYTVKVDGEELEVTLDELQSGYQRQSDYTKKTQTLAEERKAAEAKSAQLADAYDQFQMNAQAANELLSRDLKAFEQVDWDKLKAEDPVGYVQKQIEKQEVEKKMTDLRVQVQQAWEFNQQSQQEEVQKRLEFERKEMLRLFPTWNEPEVAQQAQTAIAEYARSVGYQDDELAHIMKARDLQVLEKARLYDEMQKTKQGIGKKTKPPVRKRVVKPKGKAPKGTNARKAIEGRKQALAKSGNLRDAAALMYEMSNNPAIKK